MKKIKVLFFLSTLERTGPTSVVYNIIKFIDRDLIEPIILTMSPEPSNSAILDFKKLGIQVVQLNLDRVQLFIKGWKGLISKINEIEPDIIHSHSLRPDLFCAFFLKIPTITTIHANLEENYVDTYGNLIGRMFAFVQIESAKRLICKVACSISVFDLYRKQLPSLTFVQNGVDTTIFSPLTKDQIKGQRSKLGLPLEKKIFVSVGSLSLRKDPETLIKGFLGSHDLENSLLLILGTGEIADRLRILFQLNNNVVFLGFTSNVASYLRVADFFISASISEGLPNTVMEALACGLPVCLSDIPSHREILMINPKAGRLFKVHDSEDLSLRIDEILSEDQNLIRESSIELIRNNLNAKNMAFQYLKLYHQVFNGRISI
jgi:glycosyltransferase involved in cell wall biosynthesis